MRRTHPLTITRLRLLLCALGLAAGAAQGQPSAADREPRFDILAFVVTGNTLLPVADVEAAVYRFTGESRAIADAEAARAALEKLYQDRGYLSVAVALPPQSVSDGEVQLQVVEAAVGTRRVTGAQWFLPSRIAQMTPSLAPGSLPNFENMQQELAALQSNADLRITPVVGAGAVPAEINVELKVEDSLPLHGSAELNSRQSFNTDRGRLDASLRYDNFFQRGHSLGFNWIVAPTSPSQSNTRVLSYSAPVQFGVDATPRLSATWVNSDSQTPSSLGGDTVVRGDSIGARLRVPLRSNDPALTQAWSLGLDVKHNRDQTQSAGGSTLSTGGLLYGAAWFGYDLQFNGAGGESTSFDAGLSLGPTWPNARQVDCNGARMDQFECKRSGAKPGFQVLKLNAMHRQSVFGKWTLQLRAQVQLAASPLVSGEQFGAGGLDSVRGYYEYEQVGDQGVVLGAELGSPTLWSVAGANLSGLLFAEGARLGVTDPLPSEQGEIRMASVGAGLRLVSSQGLRIALDLALPLQATLKADSKGALQPASGRASHNERRIDLSLRQSF